MPIASSGLTQHSQGMCCVSESPWHAKSQPYNQSSTAAVRKDGVQGSASGHDNRWLGICSVVSTTRTQSATVSVCCAPYRIGPVARASQQYACRLSKALSKFEMKPTYEDVYQTQHPSVDEYLRHVQQSTLLSAIQVSLASNTNPTYVCSMHAQADLFQTRDTHELRSLHSLVSCLMRLPAHVNLPRMPGLYLRPTFLNGDKTKQACPALHRRIMGTGSTRDCVCLLLVSCRLH